MKEGSEAVLSVVGGEGVIASGDRGVDVKSAASWSSFSTLAKGGRAGVGRI